MVPREGRVGHQHVVGRDGALRRVAVEIAQAVQHPRGIEAQGGEEPDDAALAVEGVVDGELRFAACLRAAWGGGGVQAAGEGPEEGLQVLEGLFCWCVIDVGMGL